MKKICNLLLLLLIISCNGQKKEQCLTDLEKRLSPKINQETIQGEIINIRDNVNCIEWDSLVVVMASNNKELIEKYSKIEIPYTLDSNTYFLSDNEAFIFFLKEGKAINHIHVSTGCKKGDKCKTYNVFTLQKNHLNTFVAKKDAVFEVYTRKVTDNRGNAWEDKNAIRIKT